MPTIGFQTFTGESVQQLLLRSTPPSPALLSCADPAQQYLEASVFEALTGIRSCSAHPFHAKRIRLSEGHAPIVFLDKTVESRALAARFLQQVLPVVDFDGGLVSSPGIRIRGVQGRDLHLGVVGTDARIIIRGATGTDWDAVRSEYVCQVGMWGTSLCFQRTLTSDEHYVAVCDERITRWSTRDALVEVQSRLLRRLAIFTEFSSAHCMYAYGGGPRLLTFWIEFGGAVEKDHDLLVEALIDPCWGLGMHVIDRYCNCSLGQSCSVMLATPDREADIAMNFVHCESRLGREYYESVGSRGSWVNRAFPGKSPGVVGIG